MASYAHQDWKPVVLHTKPGALPASEAARRGQLSSEQKKNADFAGAHANAQVKGLVGAAAAKIEKGSEEGDFHHARLPTEVRKRISTLRTQRGLTQAQLAQRVNVPPRVVQEYENGKAIPNGEMLAKLARALGVPTLKR